MGTESNSKGVPKVVKLNKALKLAESWVEKMSGTTTNEQSELEIEGRPSRLGLGARVAPKVKVATSTDPVERKLLAKLKGNKNQFSKNREETSDDENKSSDDDDEEETESRTSAFVKKRPLPPPSSMPSKKMTR